MQVWRTGLLRIYKESAFPKIKRARFLRQNTKRKNPETVAVSGFFTGEPGGIRTHDLLIRSWQERYNIKPNNTAFFCCAMAIFVNGNRTFSRPKGGLEYDFWTFTYNKGTSPYNNATLTHGFERLTCAFSFFVGSVLDFKNVKEISEFP